jgi:hypothetical protein
MSSTSVSAVFLEALDRDWTRSALAAEQKCQGFPPGPYVNELVQLRSRKTIISHLISSIVFHEGARVKSRVTPLIDNKKLTHLLDEQQVYQHYKSIQRVTSILRVLLLLYSL